MEMNYVIQISQSIISKKSENPSLLQNMRNPHYKALLEFHIEITQTISVPSPSGMKLIFLLEFSSDYTKVHYMRSPPFPPNSPVFTSYSRNLNRLK